MDQFGVLVENYGIKQQGQSASMAALKSGIKGHSSKAGNSGSWSGSKSVVDDNDDPFHFISGVGYQKPSNGGFEDLDFGFPGASGSGKYGDGGASGSDFESVFQNLQNLGPTVSDFNGGDDLFSGFTGKNMSLVDNDNLFSSAPVKVNSVDDLFGSLGEIGSGSRMDSESKKNEFEYEDELIPGFGPEPPSTSSNGTKKVPKINKPPTRELQEASFFDIGSNADIGGQYGEKEDGVNAWNFQAATPADAEVDLDSFFTASSTKSGASMSATTSEVDIDSFFSVQTLNTTRGDEIPIQVQRTEVDVDSLLGIPKAPAPNTTRVGEKPIPGKKTEVDILFGVSNVKISAEATKVRRGTSSHPGNNSFSSSAVQDFDFFGGSMVSGAFEEIEGEDDDRRRARLGRHKRTEERMAQALADMNSREFQAQQEQQERNRIADIKDSEMKLWAAGKEGNLRALLSSLHLVLWPTCGWKALSLADLITSAQVKAAYKKAYLCVHPDKVQQKGATIQEKYVAAKLFDLLKEASEKFSEKELRK